MTAKGFYFGKLAYLKSGWNVMDGFLVGVSLVDVVVSMSAITRHPHLRYSQGIPTTQDTETFKYVEVVQKMSTEKHSICLEYLCPTIA